MGTLCLAYACIKTLQENFFKLPGTAVSLYSKMVTVVQVYVCRGVQRCAWLWLENRGQANTRLVDAAQQEGMFFARLLSLAGKQSGLCACLLKIKARL